MLKGTELQSENSLEAARVSVHNLAHSVMAVGWVDAETVALAAQVGQAA